MSLSPIIEPARLVREKDSSEIIRKERWEFDRLDRENIDENVRAEPIEDDWVVYYGQLDEVYFHDGHAHFKQVRYDQTKVAVMEEAVLDALSDMNSDGLVVGLRKQE